MAEGNRKDPRARVLNMTVRYKSATVDEFIENHSHDISRGGIFIKTRSPFPAGTLLKFEVRIAEDQKLMHGVGRVVWRREVERAEESFPAGMGIKFIKTGEGATDLINQLVAAREGVESSFDAGVRQNVSTTGTRPSVVPPTAGSKPATVPPASGPALSVDSAPRSMSSGGVASGSVASDGAETAVTNPAKKRLDLAPEKRKVVLQGPALEAQAGDSAPAREHSRGSIAEETTAKRARPAAKVESKGPNIGGLLVILALVGLVVFIVNRLRGPGEDEAAPPTSVSAEPPAAVPPPTSAPEVEATRPIERPADTAVPAPNAPAAVQSDPRAPAEPGAAADSNAPGGSGTAGGATADEVTPGAALGGAAPGAAGAAASGVAPNTGAPAAAEVPPAAATPKTSPPTPAPPPPAKPPAATATAPATAAPVPKATPPAKPAPAKPPPPPPAKPKAAAPAPEQTPAPKPAAPAPAPTDTAKPNEPAPPPAADDNPY